MRGRLGPGKSTGEASHGGSVPAARPVLASSGRPSGTSQPTLGEADLRVLFVGDSLTYANDMPGLVHTLAESAGFNVWPDATRSHAFDAVRDSYLGAAQAVDGLFLPAGDVWRAA